MKEKKLLELFSDGIDCLGQRRHIDYDTEKKIQKLISEGKIIIKIKSE